MVYKEFSEDLESVESTTSDLFEVEGLVKSPLVIMSFHLLLLIYDLKIMLSFRNTCTALGIFFVDRFPLCEWISDRNMCEYCGDTQMSHFGLKTKDNRTLGIVKQLAG